MGDFSFLRKNSDVFLSHIHIKVHHCCKGINVNDMAITINCNNYTLVIDGGMLVKVDAGTDVKHVLIPEGITKIGVNAFKDLNIYSVTLPQSLTEFSEPSFNDCFNLTEIVIPPKVQQLYGGIFVDCERLKRIYIGKGVTDIDPGILYDFDYYDVDSDNVRFTSVDGILFSKDMKILYSYSTQNTGSYKVPETVEILCGDAFHDSLLSSVLLPSSIKEIGSGCFHGAEKLVKVDTYYPGKTYVPSSADVCLPPKLKHISYNCFNYCLNISSVVIPPQVKSIGNLAFYATGITSVSLPSSLLRIERDAFCRSKLTSINLPDCLTCIEDEAFSSNPLSEVNLPKSLHKLAGNAFMGCNQLSKITVDSGNNDLVVIDNIVFSKDLSKLICSIQTRTGSYVVPDTVREIGDYAFAYSDISSITIPGNVERIGMNAFLSCCQLASANLLDGIKAIGEYAFIDTSLHEVYLPDSITNFELTYIFDTNCRLVGPKSTSNKKYLKFLYTCQLDRHNPISCTELEKRIKLINLNNAIIKAKISKALTERGFEYRFVSELDWQKNHIPQPDEAVIDVKRYTDDKRILAQVNDWCSKGKRFLTLVLKDAKL